MGVFQKLFEMAYTDRNNNNKKKQGLGVLNLGHCVLMFAPRSKHLSELTFCRISYRRALVNEILWKHYSYQAVLMGRRAFVSRLARCAVPLPYPR